MKTNFHRRLSSNTIKRRRLTIVFGAFLLGVLFFSSFRGVVVSVFAPIWQGENVIAQGIGNFFDAFRSKQSLIRENTELKSKLVEVDILERGIRVLEDTQEDMLSLFGRTEEREFVSAGVLAHPPRVPYDILVIDLGRRDGVSVGDKVSSPHGGALGLISELGERESKVLLYTSNGLETEAYLERDDLLLKLVGSGGGIFVSDLPRDAVVEVGDRIFLPGIYSELVAVVEEVHVEPTDPQKTIIASGVSNISSIRFVEVIK